MLHVLCRFACKYMFALSSQPASQSITEILFIVRCSPPAPAVAYYYARSPLFTTI
jgi:hypothetical protein